MQLDTNPSTDRLLHTPEVSRRQTIIVCGGSHACRLAEAIGATHPEVVDLSIDGWKLSESSANDLANDISDALEAVECLENCTVILNIFDNSIYKGRNPGSPTEPLRQSGGYHLVGELNLVKDDEFKKLFEEKKDEL